MPAQPGAVDRVEYEGRLSGGSAEFGSSAASSVVPWEKAGGSGTVANFGPAVTTTLSAE
jgi:hypothetical protein